MAWAFSFWAFGLRNKRNGDNHNHNYFNDGFDNHNHNFDYYYTGSEPGL
jgi:hypothetical protein